MEGEKGMWVGIYVGCELRSKLWQGEWRRIAKFINRQAASIGEKLALVIRGELHVR